MGRIVVCKIFSEFCRNITTAPNVPVSGADNISVLGTVKILFSLLPVMGGKNYKTFYSL